MPAATQTRAGHAGEATVRRHPLTPFARWQSTRRAARSTTTSAAPGPRRASREAADRRPQPSAHTRAHVQPQPLAESARATAVRSRCQPRPSAARLRDRARALRGSTRVRAVPRHQRRSHPRERSRQLSGPTHARTHTPNNGHAAVGSCMPQMQPGRRGRSLKESGRRSLEMRSFFRSRRGRSQLFLEHGARARLPGRPVRRSAQRGGGSPEGEGGACRAVARRAKAGRIE